MLVNLPRLWTGALKIKDRVAESLTRLWSETMQKEWSREMQVTLVLTEKEDQLIGTAGGDKEGKRGNRHLSRLWTGVLCKQI